MRLKKCFKIIQIEDEFLAIPTGTEASSFQGIIALSNSAAFLLNHMFESISVVELQKLLTKEYDVDADTALFDIEKLLKDLSALGVLDEE